MKKSKEQLLAKKYKLKFWVARDNQSKEWRMYFANGKSTPATIPEELMWKALERADKRTVDMFEEGHETGYDEGYDDGLRG